MSEAREDKTPREAQQASPEGVAAPETAPDTASDTPPARPRRRVHHHALRAVIGLFALASLLLIAAAVVVLSLTGREIVLPQRVTSEIETRVNASLDDAKVSVGQFVLHVDDSFVPRITARHVGIIDPTGAEIARLDTLRAALSKSRLFEGDVVPATLRLAGAQLTLRRDASGAFALDFGGMGGAAGSAADVLEAIDTAFATDPLSQVSLIEARDVTVTLEDARSGRIWQATDALVTLENTDQHIDITLDFALFNGTEDLAETRFAFRSLKGSLAATVALNVTGARTGDLAPQSPALAFLSVVDAPVSAAMRGRIDDAGALAGFAGSLEIGAGQVDAGTGAATLAFDGAKAYVEYDPARERVELVEATVTTEALEAVGRGQVLLRAFAGGWPQRFEAQLALDRLVVQPEGLFAEPLVFDQGEVDLAFALDPFELRVGQVALARDGTWLRGQGSARAAEGGWAAQAQLHVDEIAHADLMDLWPQGAVPRTRDWMIRNIASARYHDLDAAVSLSPEASRPTFYLDWDYSDATIKFMPNQPPIESGAGTGTILRNRFTLTNTRGAVTPAQGGVIDSAGTVMVIPDITVKPARMELSLNTTSSVEAALSFLSEKPFNVLRNAAFGADVAQGQAEITGTVSFDLLKKIPLSEITYDISGRMLDVTSQKLVPGRTLSAEVLDVAVTPEGIAIGGPATLDGAWFRGVWEKAFTGAGDDGRSTIGGDVRIDRAFLDAFGVTLPERAVTGAAVGTLDVELKRGEAPAFTLTSDLVGVAIDVPAIGWRKAGDAPGTLIVSGTAGERPVIDTLSLEAAGLSARDGRLTTTADGGLARLTFPRATIGAWFDAPVALVGRGKGMPVGVEIAGGRFDLRVSPYGGAGAARGAAAGGGPVAGNLEEVVISDGYRLTGARVDLSTQGGLIGTFAGRLNGQAPVRGTLKQGPYGPTMTLSGDNAGAILVAAGLLDAGTGGSFDLSLTTRADGVSFDGALRVRDTRVQSAPELAELLSLASVVGVLDQMAGGAGIPFTDLRADFVLAPGRVSVTQASAEGATLGISLDGLYDTRSKTLDMQGVISPVYFLNALGQVVARKGEGLFGFNYSLTGPAADPRVSVNPLSIFTPGALRDIFRRPSAPNTDE